MDQALESYDNIRAVLLKGALAPGHVAASGILEVTMTGDVLSPSPDHYEATGDCVIVAARFSSECGSEEAPAVIDEIQWRVLPEDGGDFRTGGPITWFYARGRGVYEIWATATPRFESSRVTLVVPPPDKMRHSLDEPADNEGPMHVSIGSGGSEVSVSFQPENPDIACSCEPEPAVSKRE